MSNVSNIYKTYNIYNMSNTCNMYNKMGCFNDPAWKVCGWVGVVGGGLHQLPISSWRNLM